jgi:2',3'-cyclic-nucleotide 2'-phosphodiesterase/3'-nucleotidase/5'-nucleotidase
MHFLSALLMALATHASASQAPDSAHVVIVATTDVHGRVLGWDYVRDAVAPGGLSRAATALETLRARYPGIVVLVDAGDLLQGNPFATYFGRYDNRQPHPIVDALNTLQYDVVTPGNHDFDFGVDFLRRAAAQASYRYVSGNVVDSAGAPFFPQTQILQRGPVKIGITGFTTPGVMLWDRNQLAGKVTVRRVAASAPAALAQLQGADLKIVLTHSGFGESTYDTTGVGAENDAAALAAANPKPDIVILGHTHREVRDTVVNGVHFVQPKNWAQSLAVVHVWLQRDAAAGRYRVTRVQSDLIPLASVAEQQRFARRFDAVQQAARLWAGTPIGKAAPGFDARLARAQDTPLLDFINEVQRRQTGAQLSAAAAFDVQAGLPEGELHQREVSGIYPYENTLRAVKISGQQLREFLEHSARYFQSYAPGQPIINDSVPGYNFDVVSGVVYNIDLSRPAGQRIRGLAYGGKLVQPTDTFTMAVNSYRQAGGGGYSMLARAPIVYDKGEDIRELLVNEIRRAGTLQPNTYLKPSWAIIPDSARAAVRATFAAMAAQAAPPVVRTRDSLLLRVLTITDLHGQLESRVWDWSQGRPVGGVAALKPWLDSLTRVCGCTSVRLDAGDEMQGTALSNVTFGRGTVAALSALAIDAAAIGNHEFDWSVDTLRQRMREATYPFVSANITTARGTARPEWAKPWTLITKYGTRIAVIGLTTTETPTATAPRNVQGLSFGNGADAIKRYLPEARAQADYVIVLAHAGAACDSGTGGACHGEIFDVARQLDSGSVDLIVAGHTHRRVSTVVNGIPIIEAGSSGRDIGMVDFVRSGGRRIVRAELVTPYADQVRANVELADALNRQQQAVRNITERTVGRLKFPLKREGEEYALGRLIADAQRSAGRADAAIMNNGGIRADLPAGPVTWGQVYQVQPFQNRLQRVTLNGALLQEALEQCVAGAADRVPDCHIAGLEVWYDARKPAGKRIERIRFDNKQNLQKDRTYTLVVSDFMATGGSGFGMLSTAAREDIDVVDVDALIRYIAVLRSPVEAPVEPRFHRAGR